MPQSNRPEPAVNWSRFRPQKWYTLNPLTRSLPGTLWVFGDIPKRPDSPDDEGCPLPIPFGHPDEYENHFFINQVEMPTTMAVACPPYGYQEPFADLKLDIDKGDTQ